MKIINNLIWKFGKKNEMGNFENNWKIVQKLYWLTKQTKWFENMKINIEVENPEKGLEIWKRFVIENKKKKNFDRN